MRDYNKEAGAMLRTLRRQRQLTQCEAAHRLNTSAPVLSRKERGQEQIERVDVQLAVAGYQLNAGESYALWLAAGYLPEPALDSPCAPDLHTFASRLLVELPFPAFVVDAWGHWQVGNQYSTAIGPRLECAANLAALPVQAGGVVVQSASPYGPIDYLVLQTTFPFPQAGALVVYIPFGVENHLRYEQLKAQIGVNKLLGCE